MLAFVCPRAPNWYSALARSYNRGCTALYCASLNFYARAADVIGERRSLLFVDGDLTFLLFAIASSERVKSATFDLEGPRDSIFDSAIVDGPLN